MIIKDLYNYYHTVKNLYFYQIFGRVNQKFKQSLRLIKPRQPPDKLFNNLNSAIIFPNHDPWNNAILIPKDEICFLNRKRSFALPVDWNPEEQSLLWRYNLHYFQYIYLLNENRRNEFCRDWIRINKAGTKPAWNPYPLSLRIIHWIRGGVNAPDILKSLYQQASYLYRTIEYFYSGNHLLENARALIYAGVYFNDQGEANSWLERGLSIYQKELPEQVLPDGGFYERSPMYHALMLEGVLDVVNLLENNHRDRELFVTFAHRMIDFLYSVTHPDGTIALFNDATEEIAPPTDALIKYTYDLTGYKPNLKYNFSETGYYIFNKEPVYCIIDGGPGGPDHLLAHAHADIFSYELSISGKKMIVDTGVYEYQKGEMREYVRSTRAHNTACIDGKDQIECWDSFRVARRYKPYDVTFNESDLHSEFKGSYSGYAKLIGDSIVHSRVMRIIPTDRIIEVIDTIEGHGEHLVESSMHVHPDVIVERKDGVLELIKKDTKIFIKSESNTKIDYGWYCPQFGIKRQNSVIRFGERMKLPATLSYSIHY